MERKNTTLALSAVCAGFVHYKTATGKSEHTIADYLVTCKKVKLFFPNDPPFAKITRNHWIEFFSYLTTDYVSDPDGVAPRGPIKLAPKTIFNIHTNLASLYSWAVKEGLVDKNLIHTIDRPDFEKPVIVPLTKDEVAALLKACDKTRNWRTRTAINSTRYTAARDRSLIRLLLDTGIRAEEICDITFNDLNLNTNCITIRGKGAGRDKKERTVYFGKLCAKFLWQYLAPRLGKTRPDSPVFLKRAVIDDAPMTRSGLWQLLKDLGERAGVQNVHPHRFRHTFAITYLRNGGDVFTLQMLLGHSDMEMVRRYALIAQADCAAVHRKASPVDNWKL